MIKKAALLLFVFALVFAGGCWNYRGINDLSIVAGMAIDRGENGGYKLTCEAVDITVPVKQQGVQQILIESQGTTLFDAARNAKKRNEDKLYFGHMQLVILSRDIAENEDISGIMDWYLRDAECRETLCFAVSDEATASELLNSNHPGEPVISLELHRIIETDRTVTSSTQYYELYQMYNIMHSEGKALTMPVLHIAQNDGSDDVELNGTAVYGDGKMTGTLSPEESRYLLFVLGKIEGGVLVFSTKGGGDDTSLEISQNRTSRSFTVKDGKPVITVKTDTDVFLNEYKWSTGEIEEQEINAITAKAQQELAHRIGDVIGRVQREFGADIFGFGSMVCKQDPALWATLKDNWPQTFSSLEVHIECKINIVNTASIKE